MAAPYAGGRHLFVEYVITSCVGDGMSRGNLLSGRIYPQHTRNIWTNWDLGLGHRLWRWPNIKSTLGQRLLTTGKKIGRDKMAYGRWRPLAAGNILSDHAPLNNTIIVPLNTFHTEAGESLSTKLNPANTTRWHNVGPMLGQRPTLNWHWVNVSCQLGNGCLCGWYFMAYVNAKFPK